MKAQLSLPERPSALYLLAVLDVLAVLLIFFAVIPVVAQQAGLPLKRMKFTSRIHTLNPEKKVLLTGRAGAPELYRLDGAPIELDQLSDELARLKKEKGIGSVMAVLDESLSLGVIPRIEKAARSVGVDVILTGSFAVEETGFRHLKEAPPKAEAIERSEKADP